MERKAENTEGAKQTRKSGRQSTGDSEGSVVRAKGSVANVKAFSVIRISNDQCNMVGLAQQQM